MRKFILSVLSVSVFFMGLGALVKSTSAKFKSDEKALELVRKARTAIGGDSAINSVQSLKIVGSTTRNIKAGGVDRIVQAETEIAMQLPDKMYRIEKMGDGNRTAGEIFDHKIDVVVTTDTKDGNIEWKSADGSVPAGERKIVVERVDGAGGQSTTTSDSKVIMRKAEAAGGTWKTEDGKTVSIENDFTFEPSGAHHTGMRHNEMLRFTLSLLMSAPAGLDVSYTYGGETSIDGTLCSIVNAEAGGSTIKIYLSRANDLPVAVSYLGAKMPVVVSMDKAAAPSQTDDAKKNVMVFRSNGQGPGETVEHLVKFSDYRYVGGVQLPFRWVDTVGGVADETFVITSYEINPANIDASFVKDKVMFRVKKADGQ